jgi:hypothetical protein
MALYSDFMVKEQNQVYYFLPESVRRKSVVLYESLDETAGWPEE